MDPMLEDLAQARIAARVADAEGVRLGRSLSTRRLGRLGEEAARRARAALARDL